jgi:Glycosyl transferases group 1
VGLIVVHSFPFAPWNPLLISRLVFRRSVLRGGGALVRALGQQTIRAARSAPIAVLDFEDYDTIPRSNMFMLDRATTYFKRELPADNWRVFAGSLHRHTRTPRFRMAARHCRRLAKIRPLSLGLPSDLRHGKTDVPTPPQKTTDVFFAGQVAGSSTVRARGLAELRALKERGYAIDIVDERISPEEFRVRCARAWITWSPEGLGWQCFRNFEALACGSVPLCNHSGLQLHKRLMPGIHALYYGVEAGDLTTAVVEALADRPRLEAIAARGRDFVFEWHTPSAIARYVVATTLAESQKSKTAFQVPPR